MPKRATALERPRAIGAFSLERMTWQDVEGWLNENEGRALATAAAAVPQGQCIVELGSYCGRSAAAMGLAAQDGVEVYCVDTWEGIPADSFDVGVCTRNGWTATSVRRNSHHVGMSAAHFEANMLKAGLLHSKVHPIVGDSSKMASKVTLLPIGLLFIDADHSQEAATADFLAWRPFLAPGATVFFHDYDAFPGVPLAVKALGLEVASDHNLAWWKVPA